MPVFATVLAAVEEGLALFPAGIKLYDELKTLFSTTDQAALDAARVAADAAADQAARDAANL